jgi:hypothetical protein
MPWVSAVGSPARVRSRLEQAYLNAIEARQAPDRAAWLTRYPALAAELTVYFADLHVMDRLAREPAGRGDRRH